MHRYGAVDSQAMYMGGVRVLLTGTSLTGSSDSMGCGGSLWVLPMGVMSVKLAFQLP
jgi:hypothetical protein